MKTLITIFLAILTTSVANAYELGTHGRMTQAAFVTSVLATGTVLESYGIQAGDNPFGEKYYDVFSGTVKERGVFDDFELKHMPSSIKPLSPSGWLMRGAIREDDVPSAYGKNPQDDPYHPSGIFRVFSHFYDPVYNRPLQFGGVNAGAASCAISSIGCQPTEIAPQWATGAADVFTGSNTPQSGRHNHFTVFDAREAMYRALTGRDVEGNPLKPDPEGRLKTQEDLRKAYWATTFRALGDVVHLLQDMAQPQHTRNDPHAGDKYDSLVGKDIVVGHKSVYENYIEARATGGSFSTAGLTSSSPISVTTKPLTYAGYPIPQFNSYLDFFTTRQKDDLFARRGLADYSNRGFFSAGTNLSESIAAYAYPAASFPSFTKEKILVDWNGLPLSFGGLSFGGVTAYRGSVPDAVNPAASGSARLTSSGMWNQFLSGLSLPGYTLNRYNYDDMADLLIPRAVAYSAGMINYFFRGKLDFIPDPNNPGKSMIKNLGPEEMKGDFTLYYDDKDGIRHPITGDQPTKTWAARTVAKGGQLDNLSFTPPTDPAPKTPDEYLLVFNGDMGQEAAIPGATVGAVAATTTRKRFGALYLVGQDASGRPVSLKADGSGTRLIEGFDEKGIYRKTGEFNPLPPVVATGGGGPVNRSWVLKQTHVDGANYHTLAFAIPTPSGPISYVRNLDTDQFESRSVLTWLAKSPDPRIGTFEFSVQRGVDDIRYKRTFRDAAGVVQSSSGIVTLPSSPVLRYFGDKMNAGGSLFVSGDGTEVLGLTDSGLSGVTGSYTYYTLNLELSDVPSAALTPYATGNADYQIFASGYFGGKRAVMVSDIGFVETPTPQPPTYPNCVAREYHLKQQFPVGTVNSDGYWNAQCHPASMYLRSEGNIVDHRVSSYAADAITYTAAASWNYYFRDIQFPLGQYVVDASASGGVFFSKWDRSAQVYDRRGSGVPGVVIPDYVRELFAVLWLD